MKSFGKFSTAICVVYLMSVFLPSDACTQKFKRAGDLSNFSKDCFTKAGFSAPPTTEEMLKPDFDDKCAAKCILGAFDLIDDEGKVDKDTITDFVEDNSPKEILIKLTEVASSCVESSGVASVKGTKQGQTPEECQPVGKFFSCFVSAADKLC